MASTGDRIILRFDEFWAAMEEMGELLRRRAVPICLHAEAEALINNGTEFIDLEFDGPDGLIIPAPRFLALLANLRACASLPFAPPRES